MNIGSSSYSYIQIQQILTSELTTSPKFGKLIKQLIAAKLNLLNGANGDCITTTVSSADTLIGSTVYGKEPTDISSTNLNLEDINAITEKLTQFNNGMVVGNCVNKNCNKYNMSLDNLRLKAKAKLEKKDNLSFSEWLKSGLWI